MNKSPDIFNHLCWIWREHSVHYSIYEVWDKIIPEETPFEEEHRPERYWNCSSSSAHIIKIFIFPSDPTFHAMNICEKKFDLDKKRFFYECLKTWKSYFLAVDPYRWSQHRHAQICDVDSGTCDFRLDLSRSFNRCKLSFVVHAKCSFPACCMNY